MLPKNLPDYYRSVPAYIAWCRVASQCFQTPQDLGASPATPGAAAPTTASSNAKLAL